MTASRHERVRDLFDRAGMLSAEDRAAYLERECADDPSLAREVEELLRHNPPTAELPVPPVFDRLEDEPLPEVVGRYLILERIGAGGFGEVYLAQQSEPFERRVALKVMKPGVVTGELLARFQVERQALALLDHPGIAKILDAGALERGRLYFAMELVDGVSITEHCDRAGLDLDARLDLFQRVCQAIEHAHRRGIIHRDLKPSNVLVADTDAGPVPKVIDFGVAKAGGHAFPRDAVVTQRGQLVGTPEYMSPEQADLGGLDIDTRTDVYALGVILYELLCGALPFDAARLRGGSVAEALRIIREEEPPRPSAKLRLAADGGRAAATARGSDPAGLARRLAQDLDWMVLRALEKDRERRYPSALALAADIERFRSHQPLEARPPSLGYRMGKFVRRHRVWLAVTVMVLASLATVVTVAAVESDRRRQLAEEARAESDAVSEFLAGVLGASNPDEQGQDVRVVDLLGRALEGELVEFSAQPLVRARLLHTIGEVLVRLGEYGRAESVLEETLRIRSTELGDDHPLLADTLNLVGVLRKSLGEHSLAAEHYRRALVIQRAAHGDEHPTVAQTLSNLSVLLREQGQPAQALPLQREALAIRERCLEPNDPEVAESLANLGTLHQMLGELEEAASVNERALAIWEDELGPDHPRVAGLLNNLGALYSFQGEKERALPLMRRALAIQEATLGPDHPELGVTLLNLGMMARDVEGPEVVVPMYERVIEIWNAKLGPGHPHTVTALMNLGILRYETEAHAEALPLLQQALAAREEQYGLEHIELTEPLFYLGCTHRESGQLADARRLLERCLAIEEAHGRTGAGLASTLEALMLLHRDAGDTELTEEYGQRMEQALTDG